MPDFLFFNKDKTKLENAFEAGDIITVSERDFDKLGGAGLFEIPKTPNLLNISSIDLIKHRETVTGILSVIEDDKIKAAVINAVEKHEFAVW